jgi:hypothetical protein
VRRTGWWVTGRVTIKLGLHLLQSSQVHATSACRGGRLNSKDRVFQPRSSCSPASQSRVVVLQQVLVRLGRLVAISPSTACVTVLNTLRSYGKQQTTCEPTLEKRDCRLP